MPLRIVRNDITKMKVDAIVKRRQFYPSGRRRAWTACIHRAAGPALLAECRTPGRL